ncbi:MAG: PilW family protein [Deltaproteobacteria bacterium]|nr:PilW family protein [Deltaproteobacteria bacterium]
MNRIGNRGFTLIEMIVSMALFIGIVLVTSSAFNTILSQSSSVQRREESNIEGVVGLEMLRHDLQQAGVGLFTAPPPISYSEASVQPASTYNDATNHVPRPIVAGNDLVTATVGDISDDGSVVYNVLNLTDYLSIKATTVGTSNTSQKWTYIVPVAGGAAPYTWTSNAENFTDSKERFVVLRRGFSNPPTTTIERNTSDDTLWFKINSPAFDVYTSQANAIYTAYGFYKFSGTADENKVRFPFNRADYFVAKPKDAAKVPPMCAPNTGVLYKTTVKHADGKLTYMPILDCVADMQVVLGWDMDNNGSVDTWSNADGSTVSGSGDVATAILQASNDDITISNIRNRLKVVKVYIIAQNGKKDSGYTSDYEITIGDDGEKSLIHNTGSNATKAAYALAANMRNYRWKEYRIIVRPKNLLTNQ